MADLSQALHTLKIATPGPGFIGLARQAGSWLERVQASDGLLTLFIRHTSASLTIQENADPDVLADLTDALRRLAPESRSYRHGVEGPDDMPAHIKTMLTATSLQVPVIAGLLALGTWQEIYLVEHRVRPHLREVVLVFQGTFTARA
jgi:secondary thiamine-phosphate synthase enzyme